MHNGHLNILVVDDNPINLKLLSRTLENNNYKVFTTDSGKNALDIADTEKVDLILLDVVMPEMDGYEVLKTLKENQNTKFIPVIFLSAKNEIVDKAKGLSLGAIDYLTKPFDPVEIAARVRTQLSAHSDVVELINQNKELQQEIVRRKNGQQVTEKDNLTDFLINLNPTDFQQKNKYFDFYVYSKSNQKIARTSASLILMNKGKLLYLTFGGFENTHQTQIVYSLVTSYTKGYIKAFGTENLDERTLGKLFDQLLHVFDPDKFGVTFTFSLSWVDAWEKEYIGFNIQQAFPIILDREGMPLKTEIHPIFIESRFSSIINARKIKLTDNISLLNYISGKEITHQDQLYEICRKNLDNISMSSTEYVQRLLNCIRPVKKEQLVTLLKLN